MTDHQHVGPLQWLLVGLSIFVLLALAAEKFVPMSPESRQILQWADTTICLVFLADFVVRFARAKNKAAFMKWGWIELVSSIPMFDLFRWGRLVRVARVLRVLRGVRTARVMFQYVFKSRAQGAMTTATLAAIIIVVTACVTILHVENDPESNILSAGDALWWSVSTMTTVGYGDKFPVTLEGRFVAVCLMFTGAGLFGIFTAAVASWFAAPDEAGVSVSELRREVHELREMLNSHAKPSRERAMRTGER